MTGRSKDTTKTTLNGCPVFAVAVLLVLTGVGILIGMASSGVRDLQLVAGPSLVAIGVVVLLGIHMLNPNQAIVPTLFGRYVGTDRGNGLRWANPLYRKARVRLPAHSSVSDQIVLGAVTMVEMAKGLSDRNIVELDDERKAAMVSNLLVVLCSESETQPIINAGTLYN